MRSKRVLVADDESLGREFVEEALRNKGFEVFGFGDGESALGKFSTIRPDLVLTDVRMPGRDGLEVLREVKRRSPRTPVVLLTAYGNLECALQALRFGATDLLLKPFGLEELDEVLHRTGVEEGDPGELDGVPTLIGEDPSFRNALEVAALTGATKATVLIQGESGTGKELVARLIHSAGPRSSGPLIRVNCAALSSSLLESELFGHEKGAFTGAIKARKGRFEMAHGGTLLLDEIGEFPYELQAKILRVLEEEEFERVGGTETLKVDVHVVAATNRDLRVEVEEKRFREDLYFRLNVMPLILPPLRERVGDIPLLVHHLVEKLWKRAGRTPPLVKAETLRRMKEYPWPGNVRELENFVRRLYVLSGGSGIEGELVEKLLDVPSPSLSGSSMDFDREGVEAEVPTLKEVERKTILRALKNASNNRTQAARALGLSPRTLFNKLRAYEQEGFFHDQPLGR